MIRNIGGAALGLVVWFAATFVCFTLLWFVLGADGSFQPGSWEVSGAWIAVAVIVYAVAGAASGLACAKVAAKPLGPKMLFAVVLALGVVAAVSGGAGVDPRPDAVSMAEAMSARYPPWAAWINALVGPLAILFGASKGDRAAETGAAEA